MSKAVDISSKISTEDLESALASLRASTTEIKTVSVEYPLLKPDWLLLRRLFCVRKAHSLVEHSSFKCFCNERKKIQIDTNLLMLMLWQHELFYSLYFL